ncbi:serine hydrolase domain-containing protein [Celeribacter indicus]|uniref:Beta-lactamase n=1 Tax=Celeribacter indicus TaxID=1208324 RepID=A0A0B5E4E1_9RHOB|nr:serine hydrolase [Celeribacter indicus]AJE47212.1 beta-lactamase [Celeribacter indicus]SDW00723.1 CubicO group peptidase, beta-lactamase class C family [Celeribacter indicus]
MNRRQILAAALALPFVRPASAQPSVPLPEAVAGLGQLHSVQVQRGGEVIFSEAPRGPGLGGLANIKSCSKSLVALCLGDALSRGVIGSIEAPLSEVAPDLIPAGALPKVGTITMEDLVTLRAGLERTSGPNYGSWVSSSNWVANALGRRMEAEPGGRMLYSTGTTHVLGAALAEATGETLLAQMRRILADPLDIEIPAWIRDPQGYYLGGNEMALTPHAMLRIAVMMRDGGRYNGTQVIPADWVAASLEPRTRSPFSGMSYGYGWFLTDTGYALARGYGGQIIACHPELELAVAITSDPSQPARSEGYFGDLMALLEGPVLALA